MPDWDEMCRLSPMLLELEKLAKLLGPDDRYTNYEAMKKRMWHYVGHGAEKVELRGSDAWDTAMEHIAMRCAP